MKSKFKEKLDNINHDKSEIFTNQKSGGDSGDSGDTSSIVESSIVVDSDFLINISKVSGPTLDPLKKVVGSPLHANGQTKESLSSPLTRIARTRYEVRHLK
jgi:hypothetical protein